jgi:DNA-binding transcriptional LysR family regulator
MDIKQLNTFLEVARTKSFMRTSENLYLTQPTVSNHVKSIEQELGVHLFVRSKKQISLTHAGLMFHGYAQRIIDEYNAMKSEVRRYTATQEGHLRIFASSVPRRFILPKLMQAFHEKYPETTFTITDSDSRMVIDNLLLGETDFGFTGAKYPAQRLHYDPVFSDRLVLVSNGNEHPKNGREWQLQELQPMRFILREQGSGTRNTLDTALKDAGKSRQKTKFLKLWKGDVRGYISHSEADLALCSMLAFWCGGDTEQMDRLFRKSGLMRDKWERDDY